MKNTAQIPIFILGCQRSGTSLLRRILDSHSHIACPAESAFIVQLARVYEIKRALQGVVDMGFSEREVLDKMREFIVHFFEEYRKSKNKPRWADKTAHYINHAETIDKMFREKVVYIGIVRHGLDVANSLSEFDWGVLKPYLEHQDDKRVAAIRFWKDQNKKLLQFKDKVTSRLFLIKYEELTKDPKNVLKKMFSFLNEPWEEKVLKFNKIEHDLGFEDPKISGYENIEINSDKYKQWPKDFQDMLFNEAKDMFEKLGYNI